VTMSSPRSAASPEASPPPQPQAQLRVADRQSQTKGQRGRDDQHASRQTTPARDQVADTPALRTSRE
jgi:hypothetical protein